MTGIYTRYYWQVVGKKTLKQFIIIKYCVFFE